MIRPIARLAGVLALTVSIVAAFAGVATAAGPPAPDTPPYIYWTNSLGGLIQRSSIETGASISLGIGGIEPVGVAIDRSNGNLYWADRSDGQLYTSAGDGSNVTNLATYTAPVAAPMNPVIDARRGRVYWANLATDNIGWVALDGSDSGTLDTGTAEVHSPMGVAIDPTTDRLYWTNFGTSIPGVHPVGWVSLENPASSGTLGSGDGATYGGPTAVAVDPIGQKVYFADGMLSQITQIGTDGTGETLMLAASAVLSLPDGLSFDPSTGRLYITNAAGIPVVWFKPADGSTATPVPEFAASSGNPAVAGAGNLSISGADLSSFVGSSTTQSVTVTNTGDYAIAIYVAAVAKLPTTFTKAAAGDTCSGHVIVVGGTCTLPVTFSPTAEGIQYTAAGFVTDAGGIHGTISGTGVPTRLSGLTTVRRCAAPQNAGKLSFKFTSNRAMALKAKLVRQKGAAVPSSCPPRSSGSQFSGAVAPEDSASLSAKDATQTRTFKQVFGTKQLAPGHYRVQLSYTDFDGTLQRRTAWFWVTDN